MLIALGNAYSAQGYYVLGMAHAECEVKWSELVLIFFSRKKYCTSLSHLLHDIFCVYGKCNWKNKDTVRDKQQEDIV